MKTSSEPRNVTALLHAWSTGDQAVDEALFAAVYNELTRIATRLMGRERPDHTLEPAALIHEAYLRLIDQRHVAWQSRAQFYAIAARMMRRVLLDHAKGRLRAKRGAAARVVLRLCDAPTSTHEVRFERLDDALQDLARWSPNLAKLVELRFFAGLSVEETAAALCRSPRTIARDWQLARAWLVRELSGGDEHEFATMAGG